jgi:anti-sigma regulatory factor (Ser/Thr protein kinase)
VPVQQVAITVTGEPESIPIVRHFVASASRLLETEADMDVVALLISELTANADDLRAGEVEVTVQDAAGRLRVEVRDFGYGLPMLQHPAAVDQGGGRGLMIVDQLADDWGVDQFLPGKIVWFELEPSLPDGEPVDRPVP